MIYEDSERYLIWLDSVLEGRPRKELEQLPRFSGGAVRLAHLAKFLKRSRVTYGDREQSCSWSSNKTGQDTQYFSRARGREGRRPWSWAGVCVSRCVLSSVRSRTKHI